MKIQPGESRPANLTIWSVLRASISTISKGQVFPTPAHPDEGSAWHNHRACRVDRGASRWALVVHAKAGVSVPEIKRSPVRSAAWSILTYAPCLLPTDLRTRWGVPTVPRDSADDRTQTSRFWASLALP